jgi:hypothetical protein
VSACVCDAMLLKEDQRKMRQECVHCFYGASNHRVWDVASIEGVNTYMNVSEFVSCMLLVYNVIVKPLL